MRSTKTTSIVTALFFIACVGCGAADDDWETEQVELDSEAATKAAPDAPPPGKGSVSFERDMTERAYGVPIRAKAHGKAKVIYSVRLLGPSSTEHLLLRGEVTLSRCNTKDTAGQSGDSKTTPCDSHAMQQSPYTYAPRFSAAFVLGTSANDADGKRVSEWEDTVCNEGLHHCALALPQVKVGSVPAGPDTFVNLVVTADSNGHNARGWDVMEVEQHKGGLFVTRVGPQAGGPLREESSKDLLSNGAMGIDRPEEDGDPTQVRRLMYQVRLDGLKAGDVLDADARMRAVLGNFACNPLITAELLVTEDKDARDAGGPHDGLLAPKNGSNCPDHSSAGCRYEKSGAIRLQHGTPSTMFVSYVAIALRSCAAPGGQDKWHASPKDGFLAVSVRR